MSLFGATHCARSLDFTQETLMSGFFSLLSSLSPSEWCLLSAIPVIWFFRYRTHWRRFAAGYRAGRDEDQSR